MNNFAGSHCFQVIAFVEKNFAFLPAYIIMLAGDMNQYVYKLEEAQQFKVQ